MTQEQFDYLYQKWRSQQISAEEWQQFKQAALNPETQGLLSASVQNDLEAEEFDHLLTEEERSEAYYQLMREIDILKEPNTTVHRIHFLRNAWFRYAAAIVLIFGAGIYLWLRSSENKDLELAHQPSHQPANIQPGGNKAILTLADGRTILLDSAANGSLAQQGGTKILKLDAGSVAYQQDAPTGEISYNTISTPRGGQYQIVLPDGSKVWLNAASSLRFPTSFAGSERNVEISGEAYFEIKKDAARPFSVIANTNRILVLGTSFNVDAYHDEAAMKATLVEGSVRVSADKQEKILLPGQQATINTTGSGEQLRVANADINKVLAWKNGFFNFEDASLQTAMKQLERWYNIDVVYEKTIPSIYFVGKMSMKTNLEGVLKMLKDSEVHCRMEGRKLIIMP